MDDTAQPMVAAETDPNAQLAAAADAFKNFGKPPEKPRDDRGRFASEVQPEEQNEIPETDHQPLEQAEDVEGDEAEQVEDLEAPDDGQPEGVDLPASWSKEDAELWQSLPPEAQAKIAAREGQREQAVNSKFQELANQRKTLETELSQANASRDQHLQAIDTVLSLVAPVEPDPYAFGLGTGQYDREAYDLAAHNYRQQTQHIQSLLQQRQQIVAQQQAEASRAEQQAYAEIEEKARPAFLKDVPDLSDQEKAPQVLNDIARYVVQQGLPDTLFTDPEQAKRITSAELHMAWKAMQYDKMQAAKGRVAPKAQPKPATPTIRPGTTTSQSAVKAAQRSSAFERLSKTGSVEDAAAYFKTAFKR